MYFVSKNFVNFDGCAVQLPSNRLLIVRTFLLCSEDFESQVLVHMNDRQVIVNLPYHVLSFIVVGDIHHFIKVTLQKEKNCTCTWIEVKCFNNMC